MDTNPGMNNLSDEILLEIFSFLSGVDKLRLSETCQRFKNILCDKSLSRKLNLTCCYSVTMKDVKHYLKPKLIQQNIRVLNLTNCYWLLPSEVCTAVLNLKGLTAFYSVDIGFTFSQIVNIVIGLPELKHLSFSWPKHTNLDDKAKEVLERLSSLSFLYIYIVEVQSTNWTHINTWISSCRNLREFWLIHMAAEDSPILHPVHRLSPENRPLSLHAVVSLGHPRPHIMLNLRNLYNISPKTCRCIWFNSGSELQESFRKKDPFNGRRSPYLNTVWGECLENLACNEQRITAEQGGKVKRLYWRYIQPPFCAGDERFEKLEVLVTDNCFCLKLLQPLDKLTVLSVPACCFTGPDMLEEVRLLPKWCPLIQHLEIVLCRKCEKEKQQNELLLEMIADWPKLRVLKLSDCWNLRSGKVFDKIFRSCENLENLCMINLGENSLCGYLFEFTKALKHCKKLKDFRFEETNVIQSWRLFEALTECHQLERVFIAILKNDKRLNEEPIMSFITKCSRLIFLCIITPCIIEEQRKRLMKKVYDRFLPHRPALRCCFLKDKDYCWLYQKLPAVHLYEMIRLNTLKPYQLPHKEDNFFAIPNNVDT